MEIKLTVVCSECSKRDTVIFSGDKLGVFDLLDQTKFQCTKDLVKGFSVKCKCGNVLKVIN